MKKEDFKKNIDDWVRNVTTEHGIKKDNVADLFQLILDNRPDLSITDPDDMRYVAGRSSLAGIRKLAEKIYSNWSNTSVLDFNVTGKIEFAIITAIAKENIVVDGKTYVTGEEIQQSVSQNIVNADASGAGVSWKSNKVTFLPKNVVLYEDSGAGGRELLNSDKISYTIEVYGT